MAEEKKVLEQLKKDQDGLIKKGKLVENGLKQAQQELENFQVFNFLIFEFRVKKQTCHGFRQIFLVF